VRQAGGRRPSSAIAARPIAVGDALGMHASFQLANATKKSKRLSSIAFAANACLPWKALVNAFSGPAAGSNA